MSSDIEYNEKPDEAENDRQSEVSSGYPLDVVCYSLYCYHWMIGLTSLKRRKNHWSDHSNEANHIQNQEETKPEVDQISARDSEENNSKSAEGNDSEADQKVESESLSNQKDITPEATAVPDSDLECRKDAIESANRKNTKQDQEGSKKQQIQLLQ